MRLRPFVLVSALAAFCPLLAQAADSDVKVSSIGYLPGRTKRASITSAATSFTVKRDADGSVAYTGTAGAAKTDPDTSQSIAVADFTQLSETGKFYVDVAGVGRSVTFSHRQGRVRRGLCRHHARFLWLALQHGGLVQLCRADLRPRRLPHGRRPSRLHWHRRRRARRPEGLARRRRLRQVCRERGHHRGVAPRGLGRVFLGDFPRILGPYQKLAVPLPIFSTRFAGSSNGC